MSDDVGLVVLTEVGTAFDAELIVGALRAGGIPAFTEPGGPVDEFTMSVNMMGQGIRVFVAAARRADAEALLAELREQADEADG